jgi:hypothetical protein
MAAASDATYHLLAMMVGPSMKLLKSFIHSLIKVTSALRFSSLIDGHVHILLYGYYLGHIRRIVYGRECAIKKGQTKTLFERLPQKNLQQPNNIYSTY